MFNEFSFDAGEVTLHGIVAGSAGPTLLFLHGVTRSANDFSLLYPWFENRYRVVGLDLRGHGKSGRAGDYRVIDYVSDVSRYLEAAGSSPVILYGHSLGAMTAIAAAVRNPDRVSALVLEDPPFETLGSRIAGSVFDAQFHGMHAIAERRLPTVDAVARALGEIELPSASGAPVKLGALRDAASIRYSARWLQAMDPKVLVRLKNGEWMDGYPSRESLGAIRCPVLLLQADTEAGGMLADSDVKAFQAAVPQAIHVRFPRVGHLIHWMDTPGLLRIVTGFLESLA